MITTRRTCLGYCGRTKTDHTGCPITLWPLRWLSTRDVTICGDTTWTSALTVGADHGQDLEPTGEEHDQGDASDEQPRDGIPSTPV